MKCAPKSGSKKMKKGVTVKKMADGGMPKLATGVKTARAAGGNPIAQVMQAKAAGKTPIATASQKVGAMRGMGAATKGGNFRA